MAGGTTDILKISWPDLDEVADGPNAFEVMGKQVDAKRLLRRYSRQWVGVNSLAAQIASGSQAVLTSGLTQNISGISGWCEADVSIYASLVGAATDNAGGYVVLGLGNTSALPDARQVRWHNYGAGRQVVVHLKGSADITPDVTSLSVIPRMSTDVSSGPINVYHVNVLLDVYGWSTV